MSKHVHILLEVPPMKQGGLTDEELLKRLGAIYPSAIVEEVAKELSEARKQVAAGLGKEVLVRRIHERFTYRMHGLHDRRDCIETLHTNGYDVLSAAPPWIAPPPCSFLPSSAC